MCWQCCCFFPGLGSGSRPTPVPEEGPHCPGRRSRVIETPLTMMSLGLHLDQGSCFTMAQASSVRRWGRREKTDFQECPGDDLFIWAN